MTRLEAEINRIRLWSHLAPVYRAYGSFRNTGPGERRRLRLMAASRIEMPRRLTSREREVLDFLISVDDPAAEALRIQAATARVTEECECGCGGIGLVVDREGAPRVDLGSQETAVHGWRLSIELGGPFRIRRRPRGTKVLRYAHVTSTYVDPEDPEATGWLILQVDDGWIADIEIAWVHGSTRSPRGLPSPEGFSPPSIGP